MDRHATMDRVRGTIDMKMAGLAIVLVALGLLPLSAAVRAGEVSLVLRPVGDD